MIKKLIAPLLLFVVMVGILATIVVVGFVMMMTIFMSDDEYADDESLGIMGGNVVCSANGKVDKTAWNGFWDSDNANNLKGYGDLVLEHSKSVGIDPVLATAVMMQESGSGKFTSKNNPGGIMDWDNNFKTKRQFATMDDGIKYVIENLGRRILNDGLVSIEELGSKYAPIGAANDPQGLNKNWVPGVTGFVGQLGGLTMNCSEVAGGLSAGSVEIKGDIAWVVPETKRITSRYGPRSCSGCSSFHRGIDVGGAGRTGHAIVSMAKGEVIRAHTGCALNNSWGCGSGFGNHVYVKHEDGTVSRYAHLSAVNVRVGQKVGAGQLLGLLGNSGNSTGPHLHFEVLADGQTQIDPYPIFQSKGLLP